MGTPARVILSALIGVLAVACSAEQEDDPAEPKSEVTSQLTGCSLTRANILASATPGRRTAVQRGFAWLDDDVPYSQSASHEGYRTDCSGFVSMCWTLGRSSNTSAFYSGDANRRLGSYDELLVADALVKQGHIVLFLGWNDASRAGACVLEQASTASDMQFRVRTRASLTAEGYKPIRAKSLAAETAPPAPKTTPEPATPDPAPAADDAPECQPKSAATACAAASSATGLECGRVSDGCGGTVDCDALPSFGCETDATCSSGRCVPKGEAPADDGATSVSTRSEETGDPGDPDEEPRASSRSRRATSESLASGGCSTSSGPATGTVLPLIFALFVVARLRRRSDSAAESRA